MKRNDSCYWAKEEYQKHYVLQLSVVLPQFHTASDNLTATNKHTDRKQGKIEQRRCNSYPSKSVMPWQCSRLDKSAHIAKFNLISEVRHILKGLHEMAQWT